MKRALSAAALCLLMASAGAQTAEDLVLSYERNFVRSSLSIKLDLLKEASVYENVDMDPLYQRAVDFCLANVVLLQSDVQLRDIAVYSVNMLHKLGKGESSDKLWALFLAFKEQNVRVPILEALGDMGAGNGQLVLNLNAFLFNQNTIRQAGVQPDFPTVEACVAALGKLGSATSYPVLFLVYASGYTDAITQRAADSLAALKGDFKGYLIEVISKNPPSDKQAALRAAMETPKFAEPEKAEVAEACLGVALSFQASGPAEAALNRELRYKAVRELTQRSWSRASPLAVRNFSAANAEFSRGEGSKAAVLEAIACLGAMKTNEAAQTLTLHLQLINAETDSGKACDEQITAAVINNLGRLGDKTAFDHLIFVSYLPYPETIKAAARDALKKLKL
jgi:hypothetical protein